MAGATATYLLTCGQHYELAADGKTIVGYKEGDTFVADAGILDRHGGGKFAVTALPPAKPSIIHSGR